MASVLEDNLEIQNEDTQKGRFLTFTLGKEDYGIEIKYVTEIIGIQPITQIPELPDYLKGIINLRGKIIPVMDVRLRFGKEPLAYTDRTCIIVIDINETSIGLIVDTVSEVVSIEDENIMSPPNAKTGFNNRYVKGIGKLGNEVKLLLDCGKILREDETEMLENLAQA
jgi:purine-binding chemotaxis protein CheW